MRIALDTNVVSELARAECDPAVLAWSATFRSEDFFLPAPCWAELQRGVRMLPDGQRRETMAASLDRLVAAIGGILPFGRREAEHYGALSSERGRPRPTLDALIAAVCLGADLPLATRNVKDFDGCGFQVVSPWGTDGQIRERGAALA